MSLPDNTAQILQSLGYEPLRDFSVEKRRGSVSLTWRHADPEPSEQAIVEVGSSRDYTDWLAEHGGDATMTLRRKAKDALDTTDVTGALIRAFALVVLEEVNALRAQAGLPARTAGQLRSAIKAKIAAGDADNGT